MSVTYKGHELVTDLERVLAGDAGHAVRTPEGTLEPVYRRGYVWGIGDPEVGIGGSTPADAMVNWADGVVPEPDAPEEPWPEEPTPEPL